MTPAEQNLHDIAAAFCAPRVVRETCPGCGGRGLVPVRPNPSWTQVYAEPCRACVGKGYIVTEPAP